jgi:CrcB protein
MPTHTDRLETATLIAVGGFAGANLRYLVSLVAPGLAGTLLANVAGSLVLGGLTHEAAFADLVSRRGRLVLVTGFLASFTTYSGFAVGTARAGLVAGAGNVAANYALGFGAVLAGRVLAAWVRA